MGIPDFLQQRKIEMAQAMQDMVGFFLTLFTEE